MHDENDRQLARDVGRLDEIALYDPVSVGRGKLNRFANDARVLLLHLLGLGEARLQGFQRRGRGGGAKAELRDAIKKAAPADVAMDIEIEGFEDFRVEIAGGFSRHTLFLFSKRDAQRASRGL